MNKNNITIFKSLHQLMMRLLKKNVPLKYPNEEPLLRSELFSADQLEQHGRYLATSHKLTTKHPKEQLLVRLKENKHFLIKTYNQLTEAVAANHRITPASEWLLDNFYLIEEQIHTIKSHLPKGYSWELPHLLNGSSATLLRVYDIALEGI